MGLDLESCVDEMRQKYSLKYLASGGQGAIFRTQYSTIIVKIETSDGQPVRANAESRAAFRALRLLPIPPKLNVTVPMSLLADYSGYTMTLMEEMEPFGEAFWKKSDEEPENSWLEEMAASNSELAMIFNGIIVSGGLRRFWRAYLKAAEILAQLHAAGLVYCDFSANNIFISQDKNFCHVWLIDADNLDFQSNAVRKIVYTPPVGAPELQDGGMGCTFFADCYAFASTMFQQLTGHHPFQGAIYDEADVSAEEALTASFRGYFDEPGDLPWIFSEEDDSNSLEGGELYRYEFIPPRLFELFDRNFSAGLFDFQLRPSMNEWCFELARALDEIVRCPRCQMDRYSSPEKCSWCDCEHSVLVMQSEFESGVELWKFAHEIKIGETVEVPMRIVHGFRAKEIDAVAFTVRVERDKTTVSRRSDSFTSEFSDADTARKKSFGFETRASSFEIFCRDSGGICSRIEVKIFNETR